MVKVTSEFGAIDNMHSKPHSGTDIAVPSGTPITSIGYGVVESTPDFGDENIGKGVIVKQADATVTYGHFSEVKVVKGQPVAKGTVLGLSGSTGHSSGPHLHLQVTQGGKLVNPEKYTQLTAAVAGPGAPQLPKPAEGIDLMGAVSLGLLVVLVLAFVGGKRMVFTPISVIVMVVALVFFGPSLWQATGALFKAGYLDVPMILATIGAIWLWQFGAKFPKRLLFWGWLIFWALRGLVFA